MDRCKKVAIYIIAAIVTMMVVNGLIDVFVGKYVVNDIFGFRDVIVKLFDIAKVIADAFIAYMVYCIYNAFN